MGEFDVSDEPVITDAEVEAFHERFSKHGFDARSALAAFLKARVPERISTPHYDPVYGSSGGWNACRDAVLRGKE